MEGGDGKRRAGLAMETLAAVAAVATSLLSSSKPFLQSLPATPSVSYPFAVLLRRFLLFSLRLLFHLLAPFLALLDSFSAAGDDPAAAAAAAGDASGGGSSSAAARALSHLLSVVARVPAASRKYELVRSLADGLLDDNLRSAAASLNRGALSGAFARTLRRLDSAVRARRPGRRPLDRLAGAVRSGLRKLVDEEEGEAEGSSTSAEKMAAELVWLAGKMAECGAAEETVAMWGEAKELARVAWAAGLEPRVQVAFVRLSVFLFRHANAKQVRGRTKGAEDEEDEEFIASRYRMAMLTSWLPLLCRATNGTDSPILSSAERAEMVRVLEEMIEKLSWDQQEEVLALWLQHFSSCPDSDWPNLESCYTRWYSESRKLFLLK